MKIMLSAGEVSGDVYGSHLVSEIKKLSPDISFFGIGGDNMRSAGVDIKLDLSRRATVGLFEVLPNIFSVYSSFLFAKRLLTSENPDLLILIDSQGFNMPLARAAKDLGVKTCYFIAPQEWLWGTDKNTKVVASSIDLIIAIFKKEYDRYRSFGANVYYFGHPLLDIVKPKFPKDTILKRLFLGVEAPKPIVALCPGSRIQEIKHVFPILLKSASLLKSSFPSAFFAIPLASNWLRPYVLNELKCFPYDFRILENFTYEIISCSDLVLATSGTINLESTILGIPNIMAYKLNPFSFFFGKYILKLNKKLPFFSMPNLLASEMIVPEFIQSEATPENIFKASLPLIRNPRSFNFSSVISNLGDPPVLPKIAKIILSLTGSNT